MRLKLRSDLSSLEGDESYSFSLDLNIAGLVVWKPNPSWALFMGKVYENSRAKYFIRRFFRRQWRVDEGTAAARNFEKTFQAVEAAANLNASQLELLLFFDDPVFDVRIPMRSMPLSRPKGFARMTGVDPDENRIAKAGMDVMVMPTSDVKRGGNPR